MIPSQVRSPTQKPQTDLTTDQQLHTSSVTYTLIYKPTHRSINPNTDQKTINKLNPLIDPQTHTPINKTTHQPTKQHADPQIISHNQWFRFFHQHKKSL